MAVLADIKSKAKTLYRQEWQRSDARKANLVRIRHIAYTID